MKPRFAYLYISFSISLLILVILSFLFYNRLRSHLRYTEQFNEGYAVIINLKELEEKMTAVENATMSFLLIRDSSLRPSLPAHGDSISANVSKLQEMLKHDRDQSMRLMFIRATITNQLDIYRRTIERASIEDDTATQTSLRRGKMLMQSFLQEARQIERGEQQKLQASYESKEFFEKYYPNYFNTISIWAAIITLVSFFFVNREVRIRKRYQLELEKKLQELNRSNSELKQFAYIASHDLQEPLRKIRTFTDKLVYKHKEEFDTDSGKVISKIEASAKRMQELIQDMLNFTNLLNKDERPAFIDLNTVLTNVLKDFIEITRTSHAIISWDKLPVIKGVESQLALLFKSLFDNAFKFAKPGESPEIRITYKQVDGDQEDDPHLKGEHFHKIVMEDKGIGFNNEFAEKIFMMFQRLHTQQSGYRGKGVGLAIAQRIMTNHDGVILARGMINDGATFIMYFPAE